MGTCSKCGQQKLNIFVSEEGKNVCATCNGEKVHYRVEVSSDRGIEASVKYGAFKFEFRKTPEEMNQWFRPQRTEAIMN